MSKRCPSWVTTVPVPSKAGVTACAPTAPGLRVPNPNKISKTDTHRLEPRDPNRSASLPRSRKTIGVNHLLFICPLPLGVISVMANFRQSLTRFPILTCNDITTLGAALWLGRAEVFGKRGPGAMVPRFAPSVTPYF